MSVKPSVNAQLQRPSSSKYSEDFIQAIQQGSGKISTLINQCKTLDIEQQAIIIHNFHAKFSSIPAPLAEAFKKDCSLRRSFFLMEVAAKISELEQRGGHECSEDYGALLDLHHTLAESLNTYETIVNKTEKDLQTLKVVWMSAIKILRPMLGIDQPPKMQFFKAATNTLLTQSAGKLFESEPVINEPHIDISPNN
jgi:hypothetical protein